MKRRMLVDVKSWELAEHFLSDHKAVTKEETQDLAEAIQSAVEDHLNGFRLQHAEVPSGEHCAPESPHVSKLVYVRDVTATYTTGHCENNKQPGGCQLHNLQCGWPECDRRPRSSSPSHRDGVV